MEFGLSFCLITGASRGIGQAIAVEIAKKSKAGSVLLLLARTKSGLEETKKLVREVASEVHVENIPTDLQNADKEAYVKAITDALKNAAKKATDFDHVILVHNAATASLMPALKIEDSEVLAKDFALNFSSPVILNAQFFKIFGKDTVPKRTVVQVTSGASMVPFATASVYGSIKCARNHFFRTLAVEEPTIRVLNYDPGAVDTEMLRSSTDENVPFEEKKKSLESVGFRILQPEDTAKVLMEHLESDFKSGEMLNSDKNPDIYKMYAANLHILAQQ